MTAPLPQLGALLNKDGACAFLGGISCRHLSNLANLPIDPLPHLKVGARVMFDPVDLRAWVERQKGKTQIGLKAQDLESLPEDKQPRT